MTGSHVTAAHEAGHAVAAWLLGRDVELVSMHGPWGFPGCLDRLRADAGGQSTWHLQEDDVVISLAGPISAGLRVDFPARGEPQEARGDVDWAARAIRAITSGEQEYRALAVALRLRTEKFIRHAQFRALHEHLTAALLRDGHLDRDQLHAELTEAGDRYANTPTEREHHAPTRTAA